MQTWNLVEDAQPSPSKSIHEWVPERWALEIRETLVNASIRYGDVFITFRGDGTWTCGITETGLHFLDPQDLEDPA